MTKRKFFLIILLLLCTLSLWKCNTITYGVSQGLGQINVLYNAIPIEEALASSDFPDSLKQNLQEVAAIRQYAIDSLGLQDTKSYTKIYNQHGQPILWVLIASDRYALKVYEWDFPLVGRFPYKGFFNKERLFQEKAKLDSLGFDTHISEVAGWSTLGWFNDPILSNMLQRPKGALANIIIHEMTHATLFVKSNLSFNENLATFVGDLGAKSYLKSTYGSNSNEMKNYIGEATDRNKFTQHLLRGMKRIDSLLLAVAQQPNAQKDSAKEGLIREIFEDADTIQFQDSLRYKWLKQLENFPNNAYFVSLRTYREQQNTFKEEFEKEYNSDFSTYLTYLKQKYHK